MCEFVNVVIRKVRAVGFHYETYGELIYAYGSVGIVGNLALSFLYASLLSLILPFQIDIRTRKYILHRSVRRNGLIHDSSCHYTKGSGLM